MLSQLTSIEAKVDESGDIPPSALCELLGVERTNQHEMQFRGPDKMHRGVAALEAALQSYNNQLWYKVRYLAQYDGQLATNVHFGGRSTELQCENEATKNIINRLFTFGNSAFHILMAIRTGLSMASISDVYDSLPSAAVSDRWLSAMH